MLDFDIENEVAVDAKWGEMNAVEDMMKMKDLDVHEMAEKLNLIAAGVVLLGNAEHDISWFKYHCAHGDPEMVHDIARVLDDYDMSIKPFAVIMHEYRVGGVFEYVPLDDLLDPLVITVEQFGHDGIAEYDKKAGDVIKKALRKRKREKRKRR